MLTKAAFIWSKNKYCNLKELFIILMYFNMSSVLHDPLEIILICWFAAHETFLIIINVENSYIMFLWKQWCIFFCILYEQKVQKNGIDLK